MRLTSKGNFLKFILDLRFQKVMWGYTAICLDKVFFFFKGVNFNLLFFDFSTSPLLGGIHLRSGEIVTNISFDQ